MTRWAPRALAAAVVAGVLGAGCGGGEDDGGSPPAAAQQTAAMRLGCGDAIRAAGEDPSRASRAVTVGRAAFPTLTQLGRRSLAARGGVKLPLLAEPGTAYRVRLVAPRASVGFVPLPADGTFPPGRPRPLPVDAVAAVEVPACPPRPAADPRPQFALFVAVARDVCATLEVTATGAAPVRRRVAFGPARCG